jgi:hypothetical protein
MPGARELIRNLCLVAMAGAATAAPTLQSAGEAERVESVLARASAPDSPAPAVIAISLSALGPSALPAMFDALSREIAKSDASESRRAQVLLAAFEHESTAQWRPPVESAIAPGPTALAALAVVGRCGRAPEIPIALRCAELDTTRASTAQLEQALTELLARDGAAFPALDAHMNSVPADLHVSMVRAVVAAKKVDGAALLARWAEQRPSLRCDALPRLGSLGLELKKPLPEEVLGPVRRLLSDQDPQTVSTALVTAARLDDFDAIPNMIESLHAAHPGVRSNALWALRQLSGLELGTGSAGWSNWFAMESKWWEIESARAFARLSTGTKAEKVAVLSSISRLRAWRHTLAARSAVALTDSDADTAMLAAQTLQRLRSEAPVPELIDALAHTDARVSRAAWDALKAITRQSLPADPAPWREFAARAP